MSSYILTTVGLSSDFMASRLVSLQLADSKWNPHTRSPAERRWPRWVRHGMSTTPTSWMGATHTSQSVCCGGMYVIDRAWDRVFYEIYRHEHEGELPVYCIKHEDFSCYNYVFYITTTPYLPCNNNNINRKELYDFYYTAITLTTGYNINMKSVNQ